MHILFDKKIYLLEKKNPTMSYKLLKKLSLYKSCVYLSHIKRHYSVNVRPLGKDFKGVSFGCVVSEGHISVQVHIWYAVCVPAHNWN